MEKREPTAPPRRTLSTFGPPCSKSKEDAYVHEGETVVGVPIPMIK
jgi:hypothetical protein